MFNLIYLNFIIFIFIFFNNSIISIVIKEKYRSILFYIGIFFELNAFLNSKLSSYSYICNKFFK